MSEYVSSITADRPRELRMFVRLAVWVASAIGFGIAIAVSEGDARIVRISSLAVAGAVVALAARVPAYQLLFGALAACGAFLASVLIASSLPAVALAVLVFTFVVAGTSVLRDLISPTSDWALGGAALPWAESGNPPLLDARTVTAELNRARRYARPLSVVTISLPPPGRSPLASRRALADIASSLSLCLRQSDVIGHQGPSRLIVVLPETAEEEAGLLVERILTLLDEELAASLKFGMASFPTEEVTWVGLENLALEREKAVARPQRESGLVPANGSPEGAMTESSGANGRGRIATGVSEQSQQHHAERNC